MMTHAFDQQMFSYLLSSISQVPQREMMFQKPPGRDATLARWHVPLLNLLIKLPPKGPQCKLLCGLILLKAATHKQHRWFHCELPRAGEGSLYECFPKLSKLYI